MFKITRKSRLVKVVAATAAIGSLAAIGFAGNSPANADPKQYEALVAVGSDTTQEVMNGLAGFSSGQAFDSGVIRSDLASGQRQIVSFDATTPGGDPTVPECIITKTGGPAFERPNGSSAGRAALSRKIDGTKFEDKGRACSTTGGVDVSTSIDFARSSSGPATTASTPPNQLVYIPLGRDALTFAYYRADGGTPVSSLTQAQLNTLFNGNGSASEVQTILGVRILPCGIQTGSGTYNSWLTSSLKQTAPKEDDATSTCRDLAKANGVGDLNGRAQENNGEQLKEFGDLARTAGIADQVIIGFSASQYISKTNGLGVPAPPAAVKLGAISNNGATPAVDCGAPLTASGTANASFYNCANFGRTVYNVFAWSSLFRDTDPGAGFVEGPSFGNQDIKSLFVGPASSLCQKSALIQQFGYLFDAATCGTTTTRGVLIANPAP